MTGFLAHVSDEAATAIDDYTRAVKKGEENSAKSKLCVLYGSRRSLFRTRELVNSSAMKYEKL